MVFFACFLLACGKLFFLYGRRERVHEGADLNVAQLACRFANGEVRADFVYGAPELDLSDGRVPLFVGEVFGLADPLHPRLHFGVFSCLDEDFAQD